MRIFFLLILVLPIFVFGQSTKGLEICRALGQQNFYSNLDADNALEKILSVTGLKKNFTLVSCDQIDNATAISIEGERFIFYNKNFMKSIGGSSSNLAVLAHEVGHHLNNHARDLTMYVGGIIKPDPKEVSRLLELEADEFAGFVMAKLGYTLEEAQLPFYKISNNDNDRYSTHPSRNKRLYAVKTGFERAYENTSSSLQNNNTITLLNKSPANSYEKNKIKLDTKISTFLYQLNPNNQIDFNKLSINEHIILGTKKFMSHYFLIGFPNKPIPEISIEFGVVSNGGSLLKVSTSRSDSEVYVKGKLIFLFKDGTSIVCFDRNSSERINNDIFSYYYLTDTEVSKIKNNLITEVSFEVSNNTNSRRYQVSNDDITLEEIVNLFSN